MSTPKRRAEDLVERECTSELSYEKGAPELWRIVMDYTLPGAELAVTDTSDDLKMRASSESWWR